MSQIITRFAPSPTGMLHIGNARAALINWLYAKKYDGKFILRIDDTDLARSKDEYKNAIIENLKWLGLDWDVQFNQSSRLKKYDEIKNLLISQGRLYPCYETQEELEIKRKLQLSNGKPPIYDRASLKLTNSQIEEYKSQGRTPHYRFLINETEIFWDDMIKGSIKYSGQNLSDPVLIRADGSMTYMLCSTIDDIDYKISHVIRGEDHVSNTAIQTQLFDALGSSSPSFGHLSLIKSKDDKISKRKGGFEISALQTQKLLEPMAVNSFLAFIGSSLPVTPSKNMDNLVEKFDINSYSKSPTTYMEEELNIINQKLIIDYDFSDIQEYLRSESIDNIDESFWLAIRPNLNKLSEIKEWWQICYQPVKQHIEDIDLLSIAAAKLPKTINKDTWKDWTTSISEATGKKGKSLFMPLRLALTGKNNGPELKNLLPLISREEILRRLK